MVDRKCPAAQGIYLTAVWTLSSPPYLPHWVEINIMKTPWSQGLLSHQKTEWENVTDNGNTEFYHIKI